VNTYPIFLHTFVACTGVPCRCPGVVSHLWVAVCGPCKKKKKRKDVSLAKLIRNHAKQMTIDLALARAFHTLSPLQFQEVVTGFVKCIDEQLATHAKWFTCLRQFPLLSYAGAGVRGSAFMRAFFTNFKSVFSPEKALRIEQAKLVADAEQLAFQNLMEESNANMAAAKKNGDAIQGDDLASTPTLGLLESLLSKEDLFTEALRFREPWTDHESVSPALHVCDAASHHTHSFTK
jgi:hypothetical protein